MTVTVNRLALLRALDIARDLSTAKLLLDYVTGTLVTVESDRVLLTSTDTQIWVKTEIPAETPDGENASFGVDGHLLYLLAEKLTEEQVQISRETLHLAFQCGDNRYRLRSFDSDLFCGEPEIVTPRHFRVSYGAIRGVGEYLDYIPSDNMNKPQLSGVLLTFSKKRLKAWATDGLRAGVYEAPLEHGTDQVSVVVPSKLVGLLKALPLDEDHLLDVFVGTNCVQIIAPNTRITSSLVYGAYPELDGLFERISQNRAELSKSLLIQAVSRLLLFAKVQQSSPISLTVEEGTVTLSCDVPEIGDVVEKVKIIRRNGAPFSVNLNGRFLLDGLKSPMPDVIQIGTDGDRSPVLIRSAEVTFWYWQLPMLTI